MILYKVGAKVRLSELKNKFICVFPSTNLFGGSQRCGDSDEEAYLSGLSLCGQPFRNENENVCYKTASMKGTKVFTFAYRKM